MARSMFETGTNGKLTRSKVRRPLSDASGGSDIVADVLNAASLLARIIINVVFWRFLAKESSPSTFSSGKTSGIHSV
jgi:hypothetical protein